MPLHIIRQDITKLKCDAIVNAANNSLLGGGGVDGAIHKAAGVGLLKECETLGGCETGDAKITKGYNLPCKYVIHTVGPIWQGGSNNERKLLASCYKKSLNLAVKNGCNTVAFPLISSGIYGYPKDKALKVATKTIANFLFHNEITVYLCVFDEQSFKISEKLFYNVAQYVNDNYVNKVIECESRQHLSGEIEKTSKTRKKPARSKTKTLANVCFLGASQEELSLEKMLAKMKDNFAVTLLKLIDLKGVTDVECYKKANVSKQTWYKIMNDKDYKPSKNTVLCFAIALELSLEQTNALLKTVGFTLSNSNKFDVIIEYFLLNEEYDVFTINETLFKFKQPCLGV